MIKFGLKLEANFLPVNHHQLIPLLIIINEKLNRIINEFFLKDNISTWVKQFTISCDDYPRNLNSNNEIVSLMWANVCNWKYSEFSGFIKVNNNLFLKH